MPIPPRVFIHPSSFVDEPQTIGDGTRIHHFCHIMPGARIGARCVIGQGVFIASGVVVGDDVRIQNNVSLFEGTLVDDFVFLGPSAVTTNVTNPRAEIDRRGHYEKTWIRRGATIGANATVVCGTTIGRYAFIGAGSLVARDVSDYALMKGVPARARGFMSRHGQKLGKPDVDGVMVCPESGLRYRLVGAALRCLDLDEDAPLGAGERPQGKPYLRKAQGD